MSDMNNLKKLLTSDIRYECEASSYLRGKSYYESGQVVELSVKSEGALFVQLSSIVKGTATTPYRQNIRIVWRPDYSSAEIEGDCSCPVGYNCKHVAAACIKYQAGDRNPGKPTGPNCLEWSTHYVKQPELYVFLHAVHSRRR
jgi:uncharacterized Zn finger protein